MQYGWILDIVFFVLLIVGIGVGVKVGLVKFLCKIAGWIFSLLVALTFCIAVQGRLEEWFGVTSKMIELVNGVEWLGYWIMNIICFVGLFLLVRLAAWLIGMIGTSLVNRFKPMKYINGTLGGLVGLLIAAIVIFAMLALCTWINHETINGFIDHSFVVKYIYNWDWFRRAVSLTFQSIAEQLPPLPGTT